MKKSKKLSKQNGSTNYIYIETKILIAIQKILENFPLEKPETTTEWINTILEWYIRTMFTNGNDYIDRQ